MIHRSHNFVDLTLGEGLECDEAESAEEAQENDEAKAVGDPSILDKSGVNLGVTFNREVLDVVIILGVFVLFFGGADQRLISAVSVYLLFIAHLLIIFIDFMTCCPL